MNIADKLTTVAENQQKVYDAGIEQGRQAEWSDFWDVLQNKGNRTDYSYFGGKGGYFNGNTFKPKYDMHITNCGNMFNGNYAVPPIDLRKEALGVELDFSKCTMFNNFAAWSSIVIAVGVMDTRSSTNIYGCGLTQAREIHTVEKIILKNDGSQTNLDFTGMSALKNIVIEGTAGNNISFAQSPLTKDSIMGKLITAEEYEALSDDVKRNNVIVVNGNYYYGGVITALKSDATGKTLTLKKTAVNSAFGINVDDETTYPEGSEYYTLRHSKDNWTFTYA